LSRYEDETDFIYRIVPRDDTWVHHFDPKSKKQSMQWKLTPSEEIQEGAISRKDDGFNFWDSQGLIKIDFLEQGRTINGTYYADELRRLHQDIARKRRGKLTQGFLLSARQCAS
jgi:hypothetical protein